MTILLSGYFSIPNPNLPQNFTFISPLRFLSNSMKTDVLYMKDVESNYIREFDAKVIERGEDYVVLDRTAFYAEAGGQPTDTGLLRWETGETAVKMVKKEKGVIKHYVEEVPPDENVHGVLDWDRRYAHMRMHTSQHVLSGAVFKLFKARTVGNQVHADRSRVDFYPVAFTQDDLDRIEKECNRVIQEKIPVRIYEENRETLEEKMGEQRYILEMIPQSIRRLRVVEIEGFDICPCGGTHVRNVSELSRVHILGRRSKGKDKDRIEYELLQD